MGENGFWRDLTLSTKQRLDKLCKEVEENQRTGGDNVYPDDLIPEGPLHFPIGKCPSSQSLSSEYQMATLAWSAAKVTRNSYMKHSLMNQMSRLRHLALAKWGEDIDIDKWGIVDTEEVKYLIDFSGWGIPRSVAAQRTVTSKTTPTSAASTSAASKSKKHCKVRKCPLCHKNQTALPRHLLVHVKKGEISQDRITALVQYADKGKSLHREEQWMRKRKKIVKARRRFYKCPLCELVTAYLPTHFINKHSISRSSRRANALCS